MGRYLESSIMLTKWGSHIDRLTRPTLIDDIIGRRPPGVFVNADMALVGQLSAALPELIIVTRHWNHPAGDDARRMGVLEDPEQAAEAWWGATQKAVDEVLAAGGTLDNVYFRAVNEPVFYGDGEWDALNDFQCRRLQIMGDVRAALYGFATGTPRITDDIEQGWRWVDGRRIIRDLNAGIVSIDEMRQYLHAEADDWHALYPSLQMAHDRRDILDLHEYHAIDPYTWYDTNQDAAYEAGEVDHYPEQYGDGWLTMRYRKVWRHHVQPGGFTGVRVFLSEAGCDMVGTSDAVIRYYNQIPFAWQNQGVQQAWLNTHGVNGVEKLANDWAWLDRQWNHDPYVICGCWFVDGTGRPDHWSEYNISGNVSEHLYSLMEVSNDG